ncbi:MAG: hypothetical protein ABL878_10460 [Burkholderiales bacterium]
MTDERKLWPIVIELPDTQAWAFAEFLKRSMLDDYRARAVSQEEAYEMSAAGEAIRQALAKAGYAPR